MPERWTNLTTPRPTRGVLSAWVHYCHMSQQDLTGLHSLIQNNPPELIAGANSASPPYPAVHCQSSGHAAVDVRVCDDGRRPFAEERAQRVDSANAFGGGPASIFRLRMQASPGAMTLKRLAPHPRWPQRALRDDRRRRRRPAAGGGMRNRMTPNATAGRADTTGRPRLATSAHRRAMTKALGASALLAAPNPPAIDLASPLAVQPQTFTTEAR